MSARVVRIGGLILAGIALWLAGWRAAQALEPQSEPMQAAWARDPQWQRLLHVREGRSEVLDAEFYLAPSGREDPEAELQATLQALSAPWVAGQADAHPRCRFPARYHWLASRMDLPGYQPRDPRCQRFEAWAQLDHLRSISLLEVSGYFGNPASSFGHALLRLDSDAPASVAGLLDTSINFGAMVPPDEWALVYVWKGLTGGYQSGFSDRLFHSHDQTYARNEFRDLWQFELDLNSDQRRLVVEHLWEVVGRKFTYYFLSKNCAWRIGELIELALQRQILPSSPQPWFPPIELFFAMQQQPGLVRNVRSMPSAERVLNHQLTQVRPGQVASLRQAMNAGATSPAPLRDLDAFSLEALLAYWDYRLTAVWPEVPPDLRQARDQALRRRMSLPAGGEALSPVPDRMSPAALNPPALIGLGWARAQGSDSDRMQIRLSPYFQDFLGFHGLERSELVLLDTRVEIDRNGVVDQGRIDLVRVRKLNDGSLMWPGLWHPAWQLRVGVERNQTTTRAQVEGGLGSAWGLTSGLSVWAMADVRAWQHPQRVRLEPEIGVLGVSASWKALAQIRADHDVAGARASPKVDLGVAYAMASGVEGRLGAERDVSGLRWRVALHRMY
jgi:hypothetical protein